MKRKTMGYDTAAPCAFNLATAEPGTGGTVLDSIRRQAEGSDRQLFYPKQPGN